MLHTSNKAGLNEENVTACISYYIVFQIEFLLERPSLLHRQKHHQIKTKVYQENSICLQYDFDSEHCIIKLST
jgi:hypothetical protein